MMRYLVVFYVFASWKHFHCHLCYFQCFYIWLWFCICSIFFFLNTVPVLSLWCFLNMQCVDLTASPKKGPTEATCVQYPDFCVTALITTATNDYNTQRE